MDFSLSESTKYEIVLLAIFSVAFITQLFYYIVIYSRLILFRPKPVKSEAEFPPVSVVICARNEEDNLRQHLPIILEQDYPNFEVIVVDDCSIDETDMLLMQMKARYSNLRSTTIKPDLKFSHGKRLALTVGIKAANHEWLLLTDADCVPQSKNWIATMSKNFDDDTEVVLGYGGYLSNRGLLTMFTRFDAFFIALQYLSFSLFGKPYMGVGRNLAYRKSLFFKNKGFPSHNHLKSGDDDLFIHQVATRSNTKVEYRPEAHTRSTPCSSLADCLRQKRRHLTTGPFYRFSTKLWLVVEPLSRLTFWITSITLLLLGFKPLIILYVIIFRLILTNTLFLLAMKRLSENKIIIISLFYDLLSPIYYFLLILVNSFAPKRSRWI